MKFVASIRTFASALFHRSRVEREIDEELRAHIENRAADLEKSGLPHAEAERRAKIEFGGYEAAKEESREALSISFIESIFGDIRFGFRLLRKSPGFTAIAIITLALGIGANTAIFSVADAVLLKPLPYKDPGKLVWITMRFPKTPTARSFVPHPTYFAWRDQSRAFSGLAASGRREFTLTGAGFPERIPAMAASANLFSVLGVEPVRGRSFSAEEELPGGPPAAVLDYGLWQSRFGGDAGVLGRTVTLDGKAFTVVGVLPRGFRYPKAGAQPEVFVPLQLKGGFTDLPDIEYLHVIGRLRPGVTRAQAAAELGPIDARTLPLYPKWFSRYSQQVRLEVVSLHEHLAGNSSAPLLALLTAAALILLIACTNIANLQLSRGTVRVGELALRSALGAPRSRLARQVLTESLALSFAGGTIGLVGAVWGVALLRRFVPTGLRGVQDVRLGAATVVFAIAVSTLAGVLSGLAPVLAAAKMSPGEAIKASPERATGLHGSRFLKRLLMAAEIAAATTLMIGAGLTVRSFVRLTSLSPGFNPRHLLTAQVEPPPKKYSDAAQVRGLGLQLLDRIGAIPGVRHAALATSLPNGFYYDTRVGIEGRPAPALNDASAMVPVDSVSDGYFRTLGARIARGRAFGSEDAPTAARVAIVNEVFVRQFFPDGQDPLGQGILLADSGPGANAVSIIGVVSDFRRADISLPPPPHIFLPLAQRPSDHLSVLLRTGPDPRTVAAALRAQVSTIDKEMPISDVATMDTLLAGETAPQRFDASMMGLLAMLALLLAVVGIYGVTSYLFSRRSHEIAVRMAMGARPGDVLRMVLREGTILAGAGIVIGIGGALAMTRLLRSFLFEISPTDPATFAGVAIALTLVSLLACYIPARRAARLDPMTVLRQE